MNNYVILIPTLEPKPDLIDYVVNLIESGFERLVIVDDGSGVRYREIFEQLNKYKQTHVITFEINKGKGCALKAGFNYIENNYPDYKGIITVDSDGQHRIHDIMAVAKHMETSNALVLGSRDFNSDNVPIKSRLGNKTMTAMFKMFYKRELPDTQTGLRGIPKHMIPQFIKTKGDRFEYEMHMLVDCYSYDYDIELVPIETVYENNNEGTHFNPIKDSLKVMNVLLGRLIKFCSSSIISSLIDLVLAFILLDLFRLMTPLNTFSIIVLANTIARLISTVVNYYLNKKLVFKTQKRNSLFRYIITCIVILSLSSIGIYVAYELTHIDQKILKIIIDSLLFIVSYQMQKRWVFGGKE